MKRLAQARDGLAFSFDDVQRQRALVGRLERSGHDATRARELLMQSQATLAAQFVACERLVLELAAPIGNA